MATVACELPLNIGNAIVDVELVITPLGPFTIGGSTDVSMAASTVIPAELGQLLVDLKTDQIVIDGVLAQLGVAGGTPDPISVVLGASTYDVDANDDGTAEDLPISIPVPDQTVVNDGSASVDFSLAHFEAAISQVPIVGTVVVSETTPPATIPCTLETSTVSFPVN